MKCSSCGAEVDPNSKFCAGCGTPVSASHFCAQCGTEVGAGVAFCPGCGASQSPGGTGAPYAAPPPYQAPAYAGQQYGNQAGEIDYKGVWSRFFAAIIDGILFAIFVVIMSSRYGTVTETGFALEGTPAFVVYSVFGLYFVIFEAFFKGTIGKLILGQRVVSASGRAPGLGKSLVRNLLRIIDMLPFAYLVGIILVARSPMKQRLGDRVAGTYVVSRKSAKAMRNASRG